MPGGDRIPSQAPLPEVADIRVEEELQLQAIRKMLWKIALKRHYVTNELGLVTDADGKPVTSDSMNLAALRELRQLSESRRRLAGADAPVRTHLTIEDEREDLEIVTLVRDLQRHSLADVPIPDGMYVAERDSDGYPVSLLPIEGGPHGRS